MNGNTARRILNPELIEEFKILYDEFLSSYLNTPKGKKHLKISINSRKEALKNYSYISELDKKGEDITELVLLKLLPHWNTKNNREKGAWIHIAPAVTYDLKKWFEGAKWATKNDWPEIARAVYSFVHNCIENPSNLKQECDSFVNNPITKGMQAGFLSPIINALDPENFILINAKPLLLINYLAGTSYSAHLKDYPELNSLGLDIVTETSDILSEASEVKVHVSDLFDAFSHWLKAEKKFWEGSAPNIGYWQIAPGKQARFWSDLLQHSIAAVGFSDINVDLSGLTEDQLMDLFKKNYPDFNERKTKINFRQLWNFINLNPGDKIVTNKGQSLLLGLGIVKSHYKFRPDRPEYKHTIDVDYYKISESGIPIPSELKGKFGKTIIPLKKEDFDKMEALFEPKQNRSWIFQANSKYYDIESAIRELDSIRWSIRKHREDIKVGDKIYIWQSGKNAGIIGTGAVTSNPAEMGIDESENKYILSHDAFSDFEVRVDMKIENVIKYPISKEIIANHDDLKSLRILKAAMGTIFPISDKEAIVIEELINKESKIELRKYSKEDALENLFIDEEHFDYIMNRLKTKKNIILQGPPGVGKTFIAKRLAYYLMKYRDDSRISMIQFHQSYSYEDFIQGFRPNNDGGFNLRDGVFFEFCDRAMKDDNDKEYVFIIDEINRGNLSKIFGEMLMLIEADKRGPEFAVPLTYRKKDSDTFYIPSNVYLIGTMNTADRSLAMVDYALRRRFSFIDLRPQFNSPLFKDFLHHCDVPEELIIKIVIRMKALNQSIADDTKNLGPGYRIGHSYFCPTGIEQNYDEKWYHDIINSEIEPLLKEYWFDDPKRVADYIDELKS
jgi:5-methylcytosine-specific restriction protein B